VIDRHQETIDIQAPPDEVYDLVAAVDRVPDFSPETRRIEWIGELHEPAVGARFRGRIRWRGFTWWREVHITAAERGRIFAFETVPGRGIYNDTTKWRYQLEPTPTGTRVTESYHLTAPAWLRSMDTLLGRPRALARGMRATLATLKETAENRSAR
jgi:uncharacterized membrane protein